MSRGDDNIFKSLLGVVKLSGGALELGVSFFPDISGLTLFAVVPQLLGWSTTCSIHCSVETKGFLHLTFFCFLLCEMVRGKKWNMKIMGSVDQKFLE